MYHTTQSDSGERGSMKSSHPHSTYVISDRVECVMISESYIGPLSVSWDRGAQPRRESAFEVTMAVDDNFANSWVVLGSRVIRDVLGTDVSRQKADEYVGRFKLNTPRRSVYQLL